MNNKLMGWRIARETSDRRIEELEREVGNLRATLREMGMCRFAHGNVKNGICGRCGDQA